MFLLLAFVFSAHSQVPDDFAPRVDGSVYAVAVQADGKVLVGGQFTQLAGQSRLGLGRLNSDGSLDTEFNAALGPGSVSIYCLAVQSDGKVLVGGSFGQVGGQSRTNLARLNPNGSLDTTFNAWMDPQGTIYCLALQLDGNVLAGGRFSRLGSRPSSSMVVRLLGSSGAGDSSFAAPAWPTGTDACVRCLALQLDGKVLVGGTVDYGAGRLVRLSTFGALDSGFSVQVGSSEPTRLPSVNTVSVQPNGKVLVGGSFTTLGGQSRTNLGRLNADGSLDGAFNPVASGKADGTDAVYSMALQADGKILVGGAFTTLGGQSRTNLGRINGDGTLDSAFCADADAAGYDGNVYALGLQADGKVLVGGDFTSLSSQSRTNLGRLPPSEPAEQSLSYTPGTLSWKRSGTSPEAGRVTFEATTDGKTWGTVNTGTRVTGGWQVTGVAIPAYAVIRARAWVNGGQGNGSYWFVESFFGKPLIVKDPSNCTNTVRSDVSFSVQALGGFPLSYQWRKDGTNLNDGEAISGATTMTLRISNVSSADAGNYSVVVSNGSGWASSRNASLSVLEAPTIMVNDSAFGFGPDGHFGFTLRGNTGQSIVVESSTNLVDWAALATNTLGTSSAPFSDLSSGSFPQRFYRLRLESVH